MRKITDNLYLGDRYSSPKETEFRISCAEEIFNEVAKNAKSSKVENDDNDVIYYKFEDYPDFQTMNVSLIDDAIKQIEENIADKQIYVHCLWGVNRSASIVFMYMVRNQLIGGTTYEESQKEFWKIYPEHSPNPGWRIFLQEKYPYNF